MKTNFLFATAIIALTACNSDPDNVVDEPIAAQITASIGKNVETRAKDVSWTAGDSIGISMDEIYVNLKYTCPEADGKFNGTTMYFKNKRVPVTITAYYPYSGNEGTVPAIMEAYTDAAHQTASEQPKFDYLFAQVPNFLGEVSPKVNLNFSHKMCKVTFIFKNGNTGTDVTKIKSYTISGLILRGTFDPTTGTCSASTGVSSENLSIDLPDGAVVENNELHPFILFPQTIRDKVTMRITDSDDQYYVCDLNFKDNLLVSGNNYIFTVNVSKTGLSLESSSITDWADEMIEANASSE